MISLWIASAVWHYFGTSDAWWWIPFAVTSTLAIVVEAIVYIAAATARMP